MLKKTKRAYPVPKEEVAMDTLRLRDIAQYAIDGLMHDEPNEALKYFRDTIEMTKDECEFFGIDYEKMMEVK
jgi:hypothetical protein